MTYHDFHTICPRLSNDIPKDRSRGWVLSYLLAYNVTGIEAQHRKECRRNCRTLCNFPLILKAVPRTRSASHYPITIHPVFLCVPSPSNHLYCCSPPFPTDVLLCVMQHNMIIAYNLLCYISMARLPSKWYPRQRLLFLRSYAGGTLHLHVW